MKSFHLIHEPMPIPTQSAEIKIKEINKIYLGQGKCCRCGCGGDYTYLKDNGNELIEAEPKKIQRMVNRFIKMHEEGRKITSIDNYIFEINVSEHGTKDRVMTIILNEKR